MGDGRGTVQFFQDSFGFTGQEVVANMWAHTFKKVGCTTPAGNLNTSLILKLPIEYHHLNTYQLLKFLLFILEPCRGLEEGLESVWMTLSSVSTRWYFVETEDNVTHTVLGLDEIMFCTQSSWEPNNVIIWNIWKQNNDWNFAVTVRLRLRCFIKS